MKRKHAKRLTPEQLFAVIYEAITHYHLKPNDVLSLIPQGEINFSSDEAVIDEFHHLFEQAGDPYSCLVKTTEAGSDIDPENDDDSPDITADLICRDIGLIRISKFRHDTCADNFAAALKSLDCQSLILDLRDNPGGLHLQALDIIQMLMEEGDLGSQIMAGKDGFKSVDYFLDKRNVITTTSTVKGENKKSKRNKRRQNMAGNKPMLVLVNENTKSAAEVLAAILQDNRRAKLIGKRTYGKGRGTNNLKIPNDLELQVLGFYWFTPAGECIGASLDDPKRGIAPDYELNDNEDVLMQAVQLLVQQQVSE